MKRNLGKEPEMGQDVRVSIIGESILVEGIVVSLENNTQMKIQRINADNEDALHLITDFNPKVIIYPLGFPEVEQILSQVRIKPDVRLIGLDIECNQVLVMDSHLHRSLSLEDLQKLIPKHGIELFGSGDGGFQIEQMTSWKRMEESSEG